MPGQRRSIEVTKNPIGFFPPLKNNQSGVGCGGGSRDVDWLSTMCDWKMNPRKDR